MNEPLPPDFWDEPDPPPRVPPKRRLQRAGGRLFKLLTIVAVAALLLHLLFVVLLTREFRALHDQYLSVALPEAVSGLETHEQRLAGLRAAGTLLRELDAALQQDAPPVLFAHEAEAARAEGAPEPTPDWVRQTLEEGLAEAAPALAALREAQAQGAFRVPLQDPGLLHPYPIPDPEDVQALRLLARYGAAQAWHEALARRHADATVWLEAVLYIADNLEESSARVLALLRISVGESAVSALQLVLHEGSLPGAAVPRVTGQLEALRNPGPLQRALATERDALLRWQAALLEQELLLMKMVAPVHLYSTVARVRQLERAIAALNEPSPSNQFLEAYRGLQPGILRLLRITGPENRNALLQHESLAVRALVAQIGLQLRAWRAAEGSYPERLDTLWERRFRIPAGYNPLEFSYVREEDGVVLRFEGRPIGEKPAVPAMMWRLPR